MSNQNQDERLFCPAGGTVNIINHFKSIESILSNEKFNQMIKRRKRRRRLAPSDQNQPERQAGGANSTCSPLSRNTNMLPFLSNRSTLSNFHIAILLIISFACLTRQLVSVSGSGSGRHTTNPLDYDGQSNDKQNKPISLQSVAKVEFGRRSLQRTQRETPISLNSIDTTTSGISNGQQQQQQQQQQAATCGYPGSPAHASVTFNSTHVVAGTAASYTCDNGYELLGPPRRICQPNGSWSPVGIPFCVLNVGLGKAAMQSSTAGHGSAQKAVDGSTSPYFQASTCTMTDVEHNPWWYVNLLEPYLVQIVRIDFGQACCANRQKATIAVRVGNNRPDLGNNPLCNRYHGFIEEGKPLFLPCTRPAPGAFVSIHLESPSGSSLSICETFIYTDHALSIEQCPSFRDQPLGSTATYNGKCYLFHNNQALPFEGARKYCESRGGTLVDETSPALQGFLSWELYRRHRNDQLMGQYWLGAVRDQRQPQNWKWINGKDVQISFWNSLATQGNCSRFDGSKGWLWSDTDCSSQLNFICQYRPLSCGKPEKPTNSTLLTKNVDNATVIEYQCSPGNLLMGPKSRVCLPTGFFSEFAPKCKYLDCQFPAMIQNGDYKLLNGTTAYQSTVNYYCNEGYQLYGRPLLTCDVDERWNGPPPRCEPLLCPAPVAPSNGYVTVTSNITVPGTQATYDCRPGYELVGERLLSCLSSGSWDNSFPYCREKRQTLSPHVLQMPQTGSSAQNRQQTAGSAMTNVKPQTTRAPQSPVAANSNSATGGIQFPTNGLRTQASNSQPTSSSTGTTTSALTTTTTTTTASSTASAPPIQLPPSSAHSPSSLPASLNGLAGQFITPATHSAASTSVQVAPILNESIELSRRPSSNSQANGQQHPMVKPTNQQQQAPSQMFAIQPTAASSSAQTVSMTIGGGGGSGTTVPSRQMQTTLSNGGRQFSNTFGTNFDQTLATTNSISVHNGNSPTSGQSQFQTAGPVASSSATAPTSSGSSTGSVGPHVASGSGGNSNLFGSGTTVGGSVLGSFNPPLRVGASSGQHNQNVLANAKYSLDGIIAVAIFGGFIFLGAIITILVVIVRRKSNQSSSIDAQTISTYDSAGNGIGLETQNGLYRNYQQAWENLRFASPASQPKLSGGNGTSLITAHVSGGPSIGLKNYASPSVIMHHHHQQPSLSLVGGSQGHQNLAMSNSSAASATSSSNSSSLGGAAGSGGADPLLGPMHQNQLEAGATQHHHHLTHRMSHLVDHHHCQTDHHRHNHEDEDDDEQGVISADEANYAPRHFSANHHHHLHHHHHLNEDEGFRDTNELTINADTAPVPLGNQAGAVSGRRRLFSAATSNHHHNSSIGRSSMAMAVNRRSLGNLSHQADGAHNDQQDQRLVVTSSNSSNSTRSSRGSPPSDDHSLDRLAYGSNWQKHG